MTAKIALIAAAVIIALGAIAAAVIIARTPPPSPLSRFGCHGAWPAGTASNPYPPEKLVCGNGD